MPSGGGRSLTEKRKRKTLPPSGPAKVTVPETLPPKARSGGISVTVAKKPSRASSSGWPYATSGPSSFGTRQVWPVALITVRP